MSNSKTALYFDEAERLYVFENLTIDETAVRVNVSSRTIATWKVKGDWDLKRLEYKKTKQAFHAELYDFARKLMKEISEDMDDGVKVDTGRFYALTKMLPMLVKVKEYEDVISSSATKSEAKNIPPEVVRLIEEEILGIKNEPK